MTARTTEELLEDAEDAREFKGVFQKALDEANKYGGCPDVSCYLEFDEAVKMVALISELSAKLSESEEIRELAQKRIDDLCECLEEAQQKILEDDPYVPLPPTETKKGHK